MDAPLARGSPVSLALPECGLGGATYAGEAGTRCTSTFCTASYTRMAHTLHGADQKELPGCAWLSEAATDQKELPGCAWLSKAATHPPMLCASTVGVALRS